MKKYCRNSFNNICVIILRYHFCCSELNFIYTLFYSNLSKDDKLILPFTHLATMTSNERLHKRLLLTHTTSDVAELPHDRENKNAC